MSILIKGMEMPKSCKDCPCHKFAYDNWDRPYNYCGVTGGVTLVNCPLVEIPTPHGRLIDENELLRHKYGFSQTARVIIKNTDAVIEAEVSEE